MVDPIADMLIRIKNALSVKHEKVIMPYSNIKMALAKKFLESGYIKRVDEKGKDYNKEIEITLKYDKEQSVLRGLKRMSRPGRRMYVEVSQIPVVLQGLGEVYISTSKGILTGNEAKKKNIGGECICIAW